MLVSGLRMVNFLACSFGSLQKNLFSQVSIVLWELLCIGWVSPGPQLGPWLVVHMIFVLCVAWDQTCHNLPSLPS